MPHLGVADRVKETTTTTGTGTIDLAGAVEGYQTFVAGIGNGHETYYSISNRDADEWEVGYGTITDAATDTLSRSVVISSSNGGSLVNFSAGTKDVICTLPADRSFVIDDEANVAISANLSVTGGATFTANVSLGDSDQINLGASNDLQIYHDGSNSYIDENGTGNLFVKAEHFYVRDQSDGNRIRALSTGEVNLYYDGSEKLATTSSGIDVTGSITANNSSGGSSIIIDSATASDSSLFFNDAGSNSYNIFKDGSQSDDLRIISYGDTAGNTDILRYSKNGSLKFQTSATNRMSITAIGDILFYEDTGTTAKFFWDASAERLGIGTSSPSQKLDIDTGYLNFSDNYGIEWGTSNSVRGSASANRINFRTAGSERMRIDSSGNVGIGTTSPSHELDIQSSGSVSQQLKTTSSSSSAVLYLDGGASSDSSYRWLGGGTTYYQMFRDGSQSQDLRLYSATDTAGPTDILRYTINGDLRFATNASERMRIDSSGNVGIGTNSPAFSSGKGLRIQNSGTATLRLQDDGVHGFEIRASSTAAEFVSANAKPFTFDTNGSERMRITSGGSVGIGTSSPAAPLHITSTTADQIKLQTDSTTTGPNIVFANNDGNLARIASAETNTLRFEVGPSNTEAMRIDSSGNIGIGTSSPESTLHVVGTSDLQSPIKVAGASTNGVTLISDRYVENESFSNIGLAHSGGALVLGSFVKPSDSSESDATGYLSSFDASSVKRSAIKIDGADGQIKFLNTDTSATVGVDSVVAMTERMIIDSNGNVGIGTSSPTSKLDVNGAITASGTATVNELNLDGGGDIHSTNDTSSITLAGGTDSNVGGNITVYSSTHASLANVVRFRSSATETMRIDSSGNVGIGTSSPSQKLDVSGSGARIYITGANEDISMDASGNGQIAIDGNGYQGAIALDADAMNIYTNSSSRDLVLGVNETEILRAKPAGVDVTGNLSVTGTITETSSIDYKENVQPLEFNEAIYNVNAVKYDRKDGSQKDEVGVIAEELYKVLPDLVTTKDGKPEAVKYTKMTMYLLEALKKQNKEIQLLKEKLNG